MFIMRRPAGVILGSRADTWQRPSPPAARLSTELGKNEKKIGTECRNVWSTVCWPVHLRRKASVKHVCGRGS